MEVLIFFAGVVYGLILAAAWAFGQRIVEARRRRWEAPLIAAEARRRRMDP